jgi:hypothetical protein
MKQKKSQYADVPAVPPKKVAGKNPVGAVGLGVIVPRMVPETGGISHGFGPQAHQFGTPHIPGSHGYGHPHHARKGHLRMSGSTKAHRIGAK